MLYKIKQKTLNILAAFAVCEIHKEYFLNVFFYKNPTCFIIVLIKKHKENIYA